jgi:predicted glycosyltransferase
LKLLIDLGHPAHFHIFRNLATELQRHGHTILFTCREKECTVDLLKANKLNFISFGKPFTTTAGKIRGLVLFNYRIFRVLRNFKPNLTLGHSSIYAAQMSWLLGIPHISVEDTGNMEQIRLYKPFTKAILVPDSFHLNLGKKQIRYAGNHELAYLHPKRFTPDRSWQLAVPFSNFAFHRSHFQFPISESAVRSSELAVGSHDGIGHAKSGIRYDFVVLRFVAWHASHDKGHHGISEENKRKAIAAFSRFGQVFISSEGPLPEDLETYRLQVPPEKLHDVIASASLVYGESATVASEAALLGVPAIYLDNIGRCYTREEEDKYGLVFNFTESEEDQEKSILKGVELLSTPGIKEEWQKRRQKMLSDKIDVTAFLAWFVENWPESMKIMKATPEYTERFKNNTYLD